MAATLRNKPVDRRYLSEQDRLDYNRSGYPNAVAAEKRVKRFAGQRVAQMNQRPNTTDQFSRTRKDLGDFKPGIQTQTARLRKEGNRVRRSERLRQEKI